MLLLLLVPLLTCFSSVLSLTENCRNSSYPSSSCCSGEITLDPTMTRIEDYAFYGCSHLTGSLIIPNSVTYIGETAFQSCSGFNGSLIIPNSVTFIGDQAFAVSRRFTGSLIIPNSVTHIGSGAFYGCTGFSGSLTIPDSVTSIGAYAFYNCHGFTSANTYPNSLTYVGENAFVGNRCNWTSCCTECTLDEVGLCECDSSCNGVCVDSNPLFPTTSPSSSSSPPSNPHEERQSNPTRSLIHAVELSLFMVGLLGLGSYLVDVTDDHDNHEKGREEMSAKSSSSKTSFVIEDPAMAQAQQRMKRD